MAQKIRIILNAKRNVNMSCILLRIKRKLYNLISDVRCCFCQYLLSVQHLLAEENYKRMEEMADNFKDGLGKRLQRYVILKSLLTANYVSFNKKSF